MNSLTQKLPTFRKCVGGKIIVADMEVNFVTDFNSLTAGAHSLIFYSMLCPRPSHYQLLTDISFSKQFHQQLSQAHTRFPTASVKHINVEKGETMRIGRKETFIYVHLASSAFVGFDL